MTAMTTPRDPAAAFERFRELANDRLAEVRRDYGLEEFSANVLDPGMWVNFRNATTQLGVQFEYIAGVSITLRPLAVVDGQVGPVEGFGLDELLLLRAPELATYRRLDDFDDAVIGQILGERAAILRQYADDVLRGDFASFPELARMRAARLSEPQ